MYGDKSKNIIKDLAKPIYVKNTFYCMLNILNFDILTPTSIII